MGAPLRAVPALEPSVPVPPSLAVTLELPPRLISEIAAAVAGQLGTAASPAPAGWLNVEQAAAYLACETHRIYDLVRLRRVRHAKDGRRTLFREEWLDAVLSPGAKVE